MNLLLGFLGGVFGFKSGATVANTAGGVLNTGLLVTAVPYLLAHSSEQVDLGSVSLGFLAAVVGVAYLLIEAMRRSSPGAAP